MYVFHLPHSHFPSHLIHPWGGAGHFQATKAGHGQRALMFILERCSPPAVCASFVSFQVQQDPSPNYTKQRSQGILLRLTPGQGMSCTQTLNPPTPSHLSSFVSCTLFCRLHLYFAFTHHFHVDHAVLHSVYIYIYSFSGLLVIENMQEIRGSLDLQRFWRSKLTTWWHFL